MNKEQIEQFERLGTIQERASFLLDIGVTARREIENMTPFYQARVGDMALPIKASTEAIAIHRATAWLNGKAAQN